MFLDIPNIIFDSESKSLKLVNKVTPVCLVSRNPNEYGENLNYLIPVDFEINAYDIEMDLVAIKMSCISYLNPKSKIIHKYWLEFIDVESDYSTSVLVTKDNFNNIKQDATKLLNLFRDPIFIELNNLLSKSLNKDNVAETLLKNIANYISNGSEIC